jgi:metal-sulfur cluster biosynthetic enzyme
VSERAEIIGAVLAALDAGPEPPPAPAPGPDLERVRAALSTVIDPELGLDLVTLGMIYDLAAEGGRVRVTYTLTMPGCPMEGIITSGVVWAASQVPGVESVEPVLVWDPPWTPAMIREGAW